MTDKLTAIIYCSVPQINGKQFLKYRGIANTRHGRESFIKFAAKFPNAQYINWYDKETKQYKGRTQLLFDS